MAIKVQKVFRGYISRRDKQDFYKRKRYIEQSLEKVSLSLFSNLVPSSASFYHHIMAMTPSLTLNEFTSLKHHTVSKPSSLHRRGIKEARG